MNFPTILTSLLLIFLPRNTSEDQKKVFCYYGSESQYRSYPGRFVPTLMDANLCTHIIFAFVDVENNEFVPFNWNDQGYNGLYRQTLKLKRQNPSLKVLLAVGGWVAGYSPFQAAMVDRNAMLQFALNCVTYLRSNGMDGLDMDWEFPATRGSPAEDREKFTVFLKIIQESFENDAINSGKEKLILTMATSVGEYFINVGYEPYQIHKHVDYMLLMAYNFHGSWDNYTGHHSTLLPSRFDMEDGSSLCQAWAVNYWLSRGVPKEKMVLGLATYGMSNTLEDAEVNGINASAIGGGRGGRITRQEGILAYYEICENIQTHGWKKVWYEDLQAPYATGGDQWVSYDDADSLRIKVETLVNGYELAGAFVWAIDLDDINGICGFGRFPLLRSINNALNSQSLRHTQRSDYQYPSSFCEQMGSGLKQDYRTSCHNFVHCTQAPQGWVQYNLECPPGLSFNLTLNACIEKFDCL